SDVLKGEMPMRWKGFVLGVATGAAVGYAMWKQCSRIRPESVIRRLRDQYSKQMDIIGTWVHTDPIEENIEGQITRVFQGGLSGWLEGKPYDVEFRIDSETGHILSTESTQS